MALSFVPKASNSRDGLTQVQIQVANLVSVDGVVSRPKSKETPVRGELDTVDWLLPILVDAKHLPGDDRHQDLHLIHDGDHLVAASRTTHLPVTVPTTSTSPSGEKQAD